MNKIIEIKKSSEIEIENRHEIAKIELVNTDGSNLYISFLESTEITNKTYIGTTSYIPNHLSNAYARLVEGKYHTDMLDDASEVSKLIFPEVCAKKGFLGVIVATNSKNGDTFSVSFWNSSEDCDANILSGWYKEQVARYDKIYVDSPLRSDFTVAKHINYKPMKFIVGGVALE